MDIKVTLDERGFLPDRYAKHTDRAHLHAGVPTCSFPFEVTDVPAGTASLALTIVDFDAIPVCGFPWVHWCACGIDGSLVKSGRLTVPEDALPEVGALRVVKGQRYLVIETWEELDRGEQEASRLSAKLVAQEDA